MTKKFPRTLILGWPVWPAQSWLANYPDVTAARIYRERIAVWRETMDECIVPYACAAAGDGQAAPAALVW
ncbi:hypothetical protein [uncultured Selenomonas sp.]|uniref:hypothetical protein n=1 Tax=uncultured Selenomonas sp. TaxID=159275 RepID=UPI0025DA1E46|nr:hypothetical protein [uncultured Selenomonas sp.]